MGKDKKEQINSVEPEKKVDATVSVDPNEDAAIDFAGIKALRNNDVKKEPWIKSISWSLLEGLVGIILFLLSFVLDVLKVICQIIIGVFKYSYVLCMGIFHFIRRKVRIFKETDLPRRLNFIFNGVGYAPSKQWGNMIIFLVVEVAFILYMILVGGTAISRFIHLDYGAAAYAAGDVSYQNSSVRALVLGFMTMFIIIAYFIVWNKGVQGGYDMYQIEHLYEFRTAHLDAMDAVQHREKFDEDLTKLGHVAVHKLMANKYGYSKLSAYYISYVDFKKIPSRNNFVLVRAWRAFYNGFYAGFAKVKAKIEKSTWHTVFAKYLEWKPKAFNNHFGFEYVYNVTSGKFYKFIHTYDKYNDYLRVVRDQHALLRVLAKEKDLVRCITAEDDVSVANGLTPLPLNTKFKSKAAASRVVGFFDCSFDAAVKAAAIAIKGIRGQLDAQKAGKEIVTAEEYIISVRNNYQKKNDEFIKVNKEDRESSLAGCLKVLEDYDTNADRVALGEKGFVREIADTYAISDHDASLLFYLFKNAQRAQDPVVFVEWAKKNFNGYRDQFLITPFHPCPTSFKKQVKEFADEKFAVSVLALPTIGCLLTVIIPLLFSIALAFTNWDTRNHGNGIFAWEALGFQSLFDFGAGSGSMPKTFMTLLVWTLIWALFSTFLNYIFGIILALLIQRKTIKAKAFWRTMFVISIAVPQFITLLVISKFFSDQGAINSLLGSGTSGIMVPGPDGALVETYYLGSGTIDDPYRIVGNQGILGVLKNWTDAQGRSIVSGTSTLVNVIGYNADGTPITQTITYVTKTSYIGFFSDASWGSTTWGSLVEVKAVLPKINIIVINCWIGIPFTMLSTAGILMNIPGDLYESSYIDGASPWTQFWKITMPYVLFVTGPSLLTQFIGNINNFNVIYFLTGGGPDAAGGLASPAGYTDLLITWIYKITVSGGANHQYYLASAIGCVIFIICAFFSLIMYGRMGSTKNEEAFQ